jgi:hypothetical protein
VRLSFIDLGGSEALIGVVNHLRQDSRFGRIRASTRIGERLRLGLEGYWFHSTWRAGPLHPFRKEDHVIVTLKHYY